MEAQRSRFENASREGAESLDRYVTETSTFKDSPIIKAYICCIEGAVNQVLGQTASVALAQDTRYEPIELLAFLSCVEECS